MANLTIDELDAVIDLDDVAEDTAEPIQVPGLSAPETRKLTLTQKRQVVLRLADMTVVLADDLTPTVLFPVYDSALGDVDTNARKMALDEYRKLITGGVIQAAGRAKAGTTAGWVVGAADNLGKLATLPAGQAGSTLVIPVIGLKIGDVIKKFSLVGSLQSGGNNCTITADLRVLTAAVAGATDASLGSFAAPLTVVANTVLSSANAEKVLAAQHTVAAGESFYVLITSTTNAACTQELQQVLITTDLTV